MLGETLLNFLLGLSEGIGGAGSEMAALFHRGAVWFSVAWFAVYCTMGAWMKSRFIGRGHTYTVNVLFSVLLVNPWTLGNVAFFAALVFPTPIFLLVWALYFWMMPMLFDILLFRGFPRWNLFVRFSREWPNPRAYIISTLASFTAFIPAFMAFTLGLTDAFILPK